MDIYIYWMLDISMDTKCIFEPALGPNISMNVPMEDSGDWDDDTILLLLERYFNYIILRTYKW